MKILITGINGLLGTALSDALRDKHEIYGIDAAAVTSANNYSIDLTEFETTYQTVTKINPDIVIHTVALTDVDKCETDPDLAYKVNALASRNVAVCCQRFDAALVYISTDYVFSGDKQNRPKAGYSEYDVVSPQSVYAKTKYEGEKYVRELLNKFYIIRSSWLYGSKRKNFITQIAESINGNKTVSMADDMVSSPTYAKDLAAAIAQLIETQMYGLYHITNSGYASRYEVAKELAKIFNVSGANIRKVSLKELNLPATRPGFSAMNNYVWRLSGFKPLRPWQDAAKEFLKENNYL